MLFQEIDEAGKQSKPDPGNVRRHIDKAICYIQKAIKANPSAEHYRFWLQCFCRERNEVYK
jgi:hypothetical protein